MKRRRRGLALPFQRADGRWVVPVFLGDGSSRQITKGIRSQADALAVWKTLQHDRQRARYTAPARTVAELVIEWERHARAMRPWSESTAITYHNHLRYRIVPALGEIVVRDLTPQAVQEWLTALAEASPRQAPRTIRQARSILLAACDLAEDWGWTDRNPVRRSRPPVVPTTRADRPQLADARAILAAFPDPPMQGIVTLAVCTGMRVSEIAGLRWADVTDATITVRGQLALDGATYLPRTKTGLERELPVIAPIAAVFADQRLRTSGEGWIFRRADGRPFTRQLIWRLWAAGLQAAGLPHRPFHATRHMTTTLLRALGVDIALRRAIAGHTRDETSLGYTHVDAADLRPALSTLAGALADRAAG